MSRIRGRSGSGGLERGREGQVGEKVGKRGSRIVGLLFKTCVSCGTMSGDLPVRRYGVSESGVEKEVDVCDVCVEIGYFDDYDVSDVVEYSEV